MVEEPKVFVVTLNATAAIVFTDSTGRDIASVVVKDRRGSRNQLLLRVCEDIKIRRETTT